MALDKQLLTILACPDCRGDIEYKSKRLSSKKGKKGSKSSSLKEELKCKKCKRIFEVKHGIPIMLPKDFKVD